MHFFDLLWQRFRKGLQQICEIKKTIGGFFRSSFLSLRRQTISRNNLVRRTFSVCCIQLFFNLFILYERTPKSWEGGELLAAQVHVFEKLGFCGEMGSRGRKNQLHLVSHTVSLMERGDDDDAANWGG